jgi:hypothetical protein
MNSPRDASAAVVDLGRHASTIEEASALLFDARRRFPSPDLS